MIRAVIFDLDGVLVETEHLHTKAYDIIFKRHGGKGLSRQDKAQYLGMAGKDLARAFKKKFSLKPSAKELHEEKTRLYFRLIRSITPDRKLQGIIKKLKQRYKVAVASSGRRDVVSATLSRLGIKRHFSAIVTASDVKRAKPSPEIFLKTARKLRVKPGECIVLEDATNGVIAARRAGMRCIGIRTRFALQDMKQADAVVSSVEGALKVIRKWERS